MYKIDARTAEDIEERISKLAGEFTPEWQFTPSNPDIGSTIARIYARQLSDNIKILNQVPKIYHAEFVNFLDLTLKHAVPAASIVIFDLVDTASGGTYVPAGTVISTEGPVDGSDLEPHFSTERDLFVTTSDIDDIFMTDREQGSIIPLKGRFDMPELFDDEFSTDTQDEDEYDKLRPFVLFGEEEKNSISRYVLGIFHPTVFDVKDQEIFIKFDGAEELTRRIASGDMKFMWLSEEGLKDFDDFSIREDGSFRLKKSGECMKLGREDSVRNSLVVLKSMHSIREVFDVKDIKLSSEGILSPIDYVGYNDRDLETASFAPFSDTLAVYAECYIGKEEYFNKPGAKVTLSFDATIGEKLLDLTREQEIEDLKVIKRKKTNVKETAISDVFADEISIEYFNGIGWKVMQFDKEYRYLFAGEKGGRYELSFICPYDWRETDSGSYHGRLLRLRLLQSDNCFMRPSLHHYPVIKGMKVSYSYAGRELHPEYLKSISGSRLTDLSAKVHGSEKFTVFAPSDYTDDAIWIGFDEPLESGPIGLFFKLKGGTGEAGIRCRFEYNSIRGFKQMKVVDGTDGFGHSGIVVFMPPPDFTEKEYEGKRRFWIRVVRDQAQADRQNDNFLAHIEDIRVNAVSVVNTEESGEEDFFIDEVTAGYKTFLGSGNILDADVWVNERGVLLGDEVKNLSQAHPDDVRIEYDMTGNVTSCYVRWHEVEHFPTEYDSQDAEKAWDYARCYRIDRLTGEIIFGDGIRSEIPRVTDDVAFRVNLRTSIGALANVAAGELTMMPNEQIFVDYVTNPVRAYGGSDMETVSEALKRGADMIFSRGRLVSAGDYERAILGYSGVIDKVSVIPGLVKDGREDPSVLSLVLLMKDYKEGSFSFHRLEAELQKNILSRCELSVRPEKLFIVEPVFVFVSVTVWTEVMDMDDSFEVQNHIREVLENYFDPVSGGGDAKKGWPIGTMPKKPQILMQLAGIKKQAQIRKTSITVKYTDYEGEHECDYESLNVTPFMSCRSGVHQVNILYDRS